MGIIYLVENTINWKKYIGITTRTLDYRWNQHIYNAKCNSHLKFKLYNAMRKYGVENFKISIIEEVQDINMLGEKEKFWIDYYDTYKNGYNMTLGGEGVSKYSPENVYNLWEEGNMQFQIANILNIS